MRFLIVRWFMGKAEPMAPFNVDYHEAHRLKEQYTNQYNVKHVVVNSCYKDCLYLLTEEDFI